MSGPRVATLEDRHAIAALDRSCFARPWSASAWCEEIERGSVIVTGQPLVALACAPIIGDCCELRRIAVALSARGAGEGRSLIARIIESARLAGCVRIELEVGASNSAALALYRGSGFEVVGRRPGYYRDPPDDALLMDLVLTQKPV